MKMGSKTFLLLGLLVAIVLVSSKLAAANNDEMAGETNGVEDAKYGGGGYKEDPGRGGYGGGRRGYGGNPRHGRGGGYCRHGCCYGGGPYERGCRRCCSYAGEAVDAAKP